MTNYSYKVLLIYPAAELQGVRDFVNAEIDPGNGAKWIELTLSAAGGQSSPTSLGTPAIPVTTSPFRVASDGGTGVSIDFQDVHWWFGSKTLAEFQAVTVEGM